MRATHGRKRKSRSNSGSRWRRTASGRKRRTAGRRPSKSTRPTPPPGTISRSPSSSRATSKKRARRTRKPWSSIRRTCSCDRTTTSSKKSMTARSAVAIVSRLSNPVSCLVLGLVLLAGSAACTSFYEIPIETPIQPKMDVSMFQRVLIAGFIGGGTEDVDANLETVRLLRSQLRTKSSLRVTEAEVMQLADIAKERARGGERSAPATPGGAADGPQAQAQPQEQDPTRIR